MLLDNKRGQSRLGSTLIPTLGYICVSEIFRVWRKYRKIAELSTSKFFNQRYEMNTFSLCNLFQIGIRYMQKLRIGDIAVM